ncbi:hypothetical protein AB0M46_28070 [Dactylosporangium sp. NPDC051485]|uniref:hypothetical protein n=1 Tax=Dactylosporangium sp. NPDC051485 TaxID=3154846 RepID=UPI003432CEBB
MTVVALVLGDLPAWAATWVPWDGNHITSQNNCLSRRAYIATTYNIPPQDLRCQYYPPNSCGGSGYWLLELDVDGIVARREISVAPVQVSWSDQPVVAAC